MNRRTFFGFACGGAVAAPLALVGEKAVSAPRTPTPAEVKTVMSVTLEGHQGDEHIRALVRQGVREGIASYQSRLG